MKTRTVLGRGEERLLLRDPGVELRLGRGTGEIKSANIRYGNNAQNKQTNERKRGGLEWSNRLAA